MIHTPCMPVATAEELAVASAMSAEEVGAYRLLCYHQWQHGRLPDDDERLARITNVAPDKWPSVRAVLRPLFNEDWVHGPTDRARQQSELTHRRRSEAVKKGGRPRKSREPGNEPRDSRAISPGLAGLNPGNTPRESRASEPRAVSPAEARSLIAAGGMVEPFPAIPAREKALDWIHQCDVFPGDLDELVKLLLVGQLTGQVLGRSLV